MLQLLEEHPMCGYEILRTIKKTHGVFLGASTIYPMLKTLESKKMIKSEWNVQSYRPKKIYRITQDGYSAMEQSVTSLNRICKNLNKAYKNHKKNLEIGIITK